jgi:low temperature requirement protein LtrA
MFDFKTAATTLGGPALFLIGNLIFKRILAGSRGLSHMVGLSLLLLAAPAALIVPPLALGAITSAILVIVAIWETRSLGGYAPFRRARTAKPVQRKPSARTKNRKRA